MIVRSLRLLFAALVASALLAAPSTSFARDDEEEEEDSGSEQATNPIEADFKGMIGLGLIGAELGFVIPALAGARDAWAFIVFPVIGAGGGAAAGYFLLEKGDGEPELAVAALTTGMALVIPALVVTLAATAYEPETEMPSANGAPSRRVRLAAAAGPGLLRWSERGVLLAPPVISSGHSVTAKEALRTGVERSREVRVALLSGVF
jgi:F0F1-type ATP synthase assembly protein I